MKKIFPFFIALFLITSCGKDDDNNNSNRLSTPELLIPVNNSSTNIYEVNFEWFEVLNATQYLIEVSSNSSFTDNVFSDARTINNAYFYDNNLIPQTYYWRVKALAPGYDSSNYSQVFTFTYQP